MTGFNHTLAGTIVALSVQQPLLIIPLAFASHFVMDALPHFGNHPKLIPYNNTFKRYLVGEALACIAVLLFAIILVPEHWFILALGAAFATLPDFLWLLKDRKLPGYEWFFRFHKNIQWAEVPYGWIYEAGYFSLGILLLVGLAEAR